MTSKTMKTKAAIVIFTMNLLLVAAASAMMKIDENDFENALASILQSGDGEVKLPVAKLLDIIRRGSNPPLGIPPKNAVVESLDIKGTVGASDDDFVEIDVAMNVRLIQEPKQGTWVTLPILGPIAIDFHSVKVVNSNTDTDDSASLIYATQNGFNLLTDSRADSLDIRLHGRVKWTSKARLGFVIPGIPLSVRNTIELRSSETDQIRWSIEKVSPVSENATFARFFFTPRTHLTVHSVPLSQSQSQSSSKLGQDSGTAPVFTVDQLTSYVIGEGVVVAESDFTARIVEGSVSSMNVLISDKNHSRVTNVIGDLISDWKVAELGESAESPHTLNVSIMFKQAIEQHHTVNFQILMETELGIGSGGSSIVSIPSFSLVNSSRERGNMRLLAKTNVEIDVMKKKGYITIDPSELPASSSSSTDSQSTPVYAFKFLSPLSSRDLSLKVTRHEDSSVLICSIDTASVEVMATEEGRRLYRVAMHIRNTQKQYLKLTLPNTVVWSASVDQEPVKPAIDGESILIPLKKGNDYHAFVVNVILAGERLEPFVQREEMKILIPRVDVPINNLKMKLSLPDGYSYGERINPILKEVGEFHIPSPNAWRHRQDRSHSHAARAGRAPPPQPQAMYMAADDELELDEIQASVEMNMNMHSHEKVMTKSNVMGSGTGTGFVEGSMRDVESKGTLPVRFEWPALTNAKNYYFEHVLFYDAVDTDLVISILYQKHYEIPFSLAFMRTLPSWVMDVGLVTMTVLCIAIAFVVIKKLFSSHAETEAEAS